MQHPEIILIEYLLINTELEIFSSVGNEKLGSLGSPAAYSAEAALPNLILSIP